MSEQPANQPSDKMPQPEVDLLFHEYVEKEFDTPSVYIQRIHAATKKVLKSRQEYLNQSLDIDIPHETSRLRKFGRKFAIILFGEELVTQSTREERPASNFRQLVKKESEIGAGIFDPIPAYDRREFYCFDDRMWIWHEERINPQSGKYDITTVSYNLSDMGVLKSYGENESRFVRGEELGHLAAATEEYMVRINTELYSKHSTH